MKRTRQSSPFLTNEELDNRSRGHATDEALTDPSPRFARLNAEALWMDEQPRQRLLESFGEMTIGELLDGSSV